MRAAHLFFLSLSFSFLCFKLLSHKFLFLGVKSLTVFVNTSTFLSGDFGKCFFALLSAFQMPEGLPYSYFSLFSSLSLLYFSFAFFSFPFPWLPKLQAELLSSFNYLFSFILTTARHHCPFHDRKVLSMTLILKSFLVTKCPFCNILVFCSNSVNKGS